MVAERIDTTPALTVVPATPRLTLTAADHTWIREIWREGVRSIGLDPDAPGVNLAVGQGRYRRAYRAAGYPTRSEIAAYYGLSDAYVSRIIAARVPARHRRQHLRRRLPKAASHLSLTDYQRIRAMWRESLRLLAACDPWYAEMTEDVLLAEDTRNSIGRALTRHGLPGMPAIARASGTSTCTVSDIVAGRRLHRDERGVR